MSGKSAKTEKEGKVTQKTLETALDESLTQLSEYIQAEPNEYQTVLLSLCAALDSKKYIKPASKKDQAIVTNELLKRNLIESGKVMELRSCAKKIASDNNIPLPSAIKVHDALIAWFKVKMPLIEQKYPISRT
ncbi:hypothetical protein TVAG_321070 [Trichomonas vaginalis G3]|uniref:Uncharacterized protein n=1 Tax=Trichomonas vaginalis (strain ATCC PRA-98 / G3) TaxID=412133 RepID=A2F815_TRIV3|nr:hypothetical protein TVAGG3_0383940 [Trichomonas vaginalis G3]EAX98947.1 hypothetical protein TVAG_321070 [Trichomonas vaginalis G3]KAI5533487.1 hypothetical protein TVAGG3_0383940 [Trichomonas vaginalis G3]|eukprot:XP_001311877.1 hypothetical protein [Trichomonas vaginalis G3]